MFTVTRYRVQHHLVWQLYPVSTRYIVIPKIKLLQPMVINTRKLWHVLFRDVPEGYLPLRSETSCLCFRLGFLLQMKAWEQRRNVHQQKVTPFILILDYQKIHVSIKPHPVFIHTYTDAHLLLFYKLRSVCYDHTMVIFFNSRDWSFKLWTFL